MYNVDVDDKDNYPTKGGYLPSIEKKVWQKEPIHGHKQDPGQRTQIKRKLIWYHEKGRSLRFKGSQG
jgi:hypothetical protein